ncbi:LysR family transcriptional regulator [Undibacterium oligocarboniphilum]|uniref:LysR family transcriptional regulator n=1 Tax=Undibacterium oligocarboniphilum TaxID=666702 RepID=A0A850QGE2_9BURK|nr:LysR family transcriptional regulator [Undibacterium oligocarboniphilum]MBC3870558.1 LysR family transcriptional regulator [Undibacterium oligocarboniphilum]NVO78641.1 LysR family transcriptional regulator [Undibacterium oligocarboniphilum]
MDRLQSMRLFSKVVELGSFARAGQALEMSNAVVTRYIADLENHLGTRLLNRSTRRLSLTETGHVYLERVRQILADIDDAEAIASYASRKPGGTLRLYSVPHFGKAQLAPLLPEFAREFPDVVLDIKITDRHIDLVEEGIDVGFFLNLQKVDANMISRKLATSEVLVCAAPAYLEKYGTPATPDDITQHRCLNFSYEFLRDHWLVRERCQDPSAMRQIPIQSSLISNNADVLRVCALAGMGLVLRTSFQQGDDIEQGRLIRLFPGHCFGTVSISMVYPSRRQLSAKVRSFVDFIAARFPHPEQDIWQQNV